MKVQVQLFALLLKYSPNDKSSFSMELKADASVRDLISTLAIPADESRIIIVSGRHSNEDKVLKDGDEVAIMTPVEGG